MTRFAFIGLVLVAGCGTSAPRDPLHFERHFIVAQVEPIIGPQGLKPSRFKAVEVYPFTGMMVTGDTLLIAIQHFDRYTLGPILDESRSADLFIACHPERMTITDRKNHIYPDAKGLIAVVEFGFVTRGRPVHMIAVIAERMPRWVLVMAQTGQLKVIQP